MTQEALAQLLGVSNQAVSKWEGDDDLHTVLFLGHRLLRGRERFRQEYDEVRRSVTLHFTGAAKDIYSDFSIACTDSAISGDVKADAGVQCGIVRCDVHAGKSVTCGDVQGDVNAVTVQQS